MSRSKHDAGRGHCPIAIIGMGCMFPRARNLREFWRLLRRGEDGITDVPSTHWPINEYVSDDPKAADQTYCGRGGFLSPVAFDPTEFGIPPAILEATDTSQLLSLVVAREALDDAGYGEGREFNRERVSVILGVTGTQQLALPLAARLGHPLWRKALREAGVDHEVAEDVVQRIADGYVGWQENSFPGLLGNVVAGRIANRLNLRGTNCVVDAACASSLSAVHLATLELSAGRCDMALTGGADTLNDIFMYVCFSKSTALSPTGDARPFSDQADGTVLGEGIGMLVLKRLADAERDGDRVYAVISAIGTSSDGRSQSIYAPHPGGQARALRNAYRLAGFGPQTVGLIEAHGTGTKVGDLAEFEALRTVFREAQSDGRWCALGSVKSQIGHTKAAAGAAGLIKTALALYHRSLPPTIKIQQPNPKLEVDDSPFCLNVDLRPWAARAGKPRRAGVSSFGFGGSNFHVVLEEHRTALSEVAWDGSTEIIALSAQSDAELGAMLNDWLAFADQPHSPGGEGLRKAQLAHKASLSRHAFLPAHPCRLVAVVESGDDLAALLRRAHESLARESSPARESLLAPQPSGSPSRRSSPQISNVFHGHGPPPGKLAFLFAGQGSQYLCMCRDLACTFPEILAALEEANALSDDGDPTLSDSIYPPGLLSDEQRQRYAAALTQTETAQPAIGAISLGLARVLERFGVRPDLAAGHSFGELVALSVAGHYNAETLHRLARLRGRLMAEGHGDRGTMLAVRAPLAELARLVEQSKIDVVIANRNAPDQGVLSGSRDEIGRAFEACRRQGWAAKALTVSGGFHSRLMEAAVNPFRHALEAVAFEPARIPVYANATADAYPANAAAARELLAQQLVRPVDWLGEIENLYAAGARSFVEVGPKAVLSGLVGAILKRRPHCALAVDASAGRQSGIADLARVLAQLAALGYGVDLARWESPAPEPRQPKMVIPLVGANYRSAKPAASASTAIVLPRVSAAASVVAPTCDTAASAAGSQYGAAVSAVSVTSAPSGLRGARDNAPRPQNIKVEAPPPPGNPVAASPQPPVIDQPAASARADLPPLSAQHTPLSSPSFPEALRFVQEGILAMQRIGQETAEAHRRFLVAQEQAHRNIQQLLENQQQMLFGPAAPNSAPSVVEIEPPPASQPAAATALPKPLATESPADLAVESIVLDVVCQKTGYPREMVNIDMDIEADLGVDSIKRVEILAGVEERLPGSSGVRPDYAGGLRTLREIVAHIRDGSGPRPRAAEGRARLQPSSKAEALSIAGQTKSTNDAPPPDFIAQLSALSNQRTPTPVAASPSPDAFAETLLVVVSQLTGYPREMLNLDMDMEADLGIDSIKRVEILAAVESKMPGLPAFKPDRMGSLRTLREIVDYFSAQSPAPASVITPSTPTTSLPLSEPAPVAAHVDRSVLRSIELPPLPSASIPIDANSVTCVSDDGTGLSREIVASLVAAGHQARLIGLQANDVDLPPRVAGLVFVAPPAESTKSVWELHRERLLKTAFATTKLLAGHLKDAATRGGALLAVVTRMDGSFGLSGGSFDPLQGGLAGLVKTAAKEWPGTACHAIDLSPDWADSRAAAQAIVRELGAEGPIEVGLSLAGRRGLDAVEQGTSPGTLPLSEGDVVVITGGARGVAAEAAIALAQSCAPQLILLGRSPHPAAEPSWLAGLDDEAAVKQAIMAHEFSAQAKPSPAMLQAAFNRHMANREIHRNIGRIAAAGSVVAYRAVDVRDAAAVRAAMEDIRRSIGPIRGLIHAAGVLEDRRLEDKTQQQFDAVFDTKVAGLRNSLDALPLHDLRCLVLFSSVSGRFGNPGQVDYAMANEVLNKAAQRLAVDLPSCRVVSINWGPWDGGMVNPALKREFLRRGIELIPLEAGGRMLVDEIRHAGDRAAEVIIGNWPTPAPPAPAGQNARRKPPTKPHDATSAGVQTVSLAFERTLDIDRHPFILSHVLDGRPVLPAAMTLEWLAHAALHASPGLTLHGLDELRVLKGVVLRDGALPLRFMTAKASRSGSLVDLPVELRGSGPKEAEIVHARATAVLTTDRPSPPRADIPPGLAAKPYQRSPDQIYAELLFHGEHFRGIESVQGISPAGMIARLRTAAPPGQWMHDPLRSNWITDPLVIDACFQLAVLWTIEEIGVPSLPSFVRRYRQYCASFPRNGVVAVLQVERQSPHVMASTITLLDDAGCIAARIEGCECTADASLREAFRRHSVSVGVAE